MKKIFKFSWLRFLGFFFIVLFSVLALLVGTQAGSRWLLDVVMGQINGRMEQVEGTIWSGIRSKELEIVTPALKVSAKDNALAVNWLALLRLRFHVEHLSTADLRLELFPVESKTDDEGSGELSLPISIQVDTVSVGQFNMLDTAGKSLPVELSNFQLNKVLLDSAGVTTGELTSLEVAHPDIKSSLQGSVELEKLAYPWPMHLNLNAVNIGPHTQSPLCVDYLLGKTTDVRIQASCQVDALIQVDGGLDDLKIALSADGVEQGLHLGVTTTLDLEASVPVREADIDVQVAKDMRLQAQLQSELYPPLTTEGGDATEAGDVTKVVQQLTAKILTDHFTLELVEPGSRLDTDMDIQVNFDRDAQLEHLLVKGGLFRGSEWRHAPLTGGISLDIDFSEVYEESDVTAWERLRLPKLDVLLRLGENRIEAVGHFLEARNIEEGLRLHADIQDLSQLAAGLAGSAELQLNLVGNLATHDVKAQLSYEPQPADAEQLSPLELVEATIGLGKEPLRLQLDLIGDLSSEQGLYRWQAEAERFVFEHADIALRQTETPLPLSFEQSADDFLFAVGESALAIRLPGEHDGLLQHQGTSLSSVGWQSAGKFDDLVIDNRLIQLLGLEEFAQTKLAALERLDASTFDEEDRLNYQEALDAARRAVQRKAPIASIAYGGSWDLAANPDLSGHITLQRHSGETLLPLEYPLPLDLANLDIRLDSQLSEAGVKQLLIKAQGAGERADLQADLNLENGFAMGLKQATVDLTTIDGGTLALDVNTEPDLSQDKVERWRARLSSQGIDFSDFALGHLPPEAILELEGEVLATVLQTHQLLDLQPDVRIQSGSQWNGRALEGQLKFLADFSGVFALAQQIALDPSLAEPKWYQLKLRDADTWLQLEEDSLIKLTGDLGADADRLMLSMHMPELAHWWPSLPGQAQVELMLAGDTALHGINLDLLYDSFLPQDKLTQPLQVHVSGAGVVQYEESMPQRWVFGLDELEASYAGMSLSAEEAIGLYLNLQTATQQFNWELGEFILSVLYPDEREARIRHYESRGQGAHWQTAGSLEQIITSMPLVDYWLSMPAGLSSKKEVSMPKVVGPEEELVFDGNWQFEQHDQLSGELSLERQGYSGIWPFPTPLPLDFDRLSVRIDDSTEAAALDTGLTPAGMHISAEGEGPNSQLAADVFLHPSSTFMLEQAKLNVQLPDDSALTAYLFTRNEGDLYESTRLSGMVSTRGIALYKVSYGAIPPGMINGNVHFNALLSADNQPQQVVVLGEIAEGSRWNQQPLSGDLDIALRFKEEGDINLSNADIDLRLGQSHILSQGAFGASANDELLLSVKASQLSALWPGLPGAIDLDLSLSGSIQDNQLRTKGLFSQGDSKEIGKAPIAFELSVDGGWDTLTAEGYEGWSGQINSLDVSHAGFGVIQSTPVDLEFIPQGVGGQPQWTLGASTMTIILPGDHRLNLEQGGSTGKEGRFDTSGALRNLSLSPKVIEDLSAALGLEGAGSNDKKPLNHGIIVRGREAAIANPPIFDLVWDLDFDGALSGTAEINHRSGDFMIPIDPPVPLGLRNMALKINSQKQTGNQSLLNAELTVATATRGRFDANARMTLDGFNPIFDNTTQARVIGQMDDISWLSSLTGDLIELGGRVDIDVTANYRGGNWVTAGGVQASGLRVVEVENGIRLLDGTLDLGLNGNDVVIRRLYFPSVTRIVPQEWRTRQWIEENPPAQRGSLNITGQWNLVNQRGNVVATLDHYPILQRNDRFAMMSGSVTVDAALPRINVDGKITADAGWVSVDIKGNAPTLDSDVVIVRRGEEVEPAAPSDLDLNLNFTVDLGPRFYVVGFGLDAGLIGAITLKQANNELTAEGEFNTRGGAIEAYGQRLQIRRGRIGFQGDISNPVLDIEALRRNQEVEAGLRVVGNARNPKISLVSHPEVSDVEKLSWLIMGRGPDSSGGDLAMLFAVGTSLIGDDDGTSEPFYRQLGIDDIAIRKGDVGETGSLLPRRTVGDSTSYIGQEDISEQFVHIAKRLRDGVNLSIEQALSGSGTVARVSYTLIRNLTVDAKVGTTNGLELVYRRMFRD